MKLSELLEAAVLSLEMTEITATLKGYSDARMKCANNKQALRAIAPALVAAMKDAVGRHTEIEDHNALCSACRLQRILSEAGVTCE